MAFAQGYIISIFCQVTFVRCSAIPSYTVRYDIGEFEHVNRMFSRISFTFTFGIIIAYSTSIWTPMHTRNTSASTLLCIVKGYFRKLVGSFVVQDIMISDFLLSDLVRLVDHCHVTRSACQPP